MYTNNLIYIHTYLSHAYNTHTSHWEAGIVFLEYYLNTQYMRTKNTSKI